MFSGIFYLVILGNRLRLLIGLSVPPGIIFFGISLIFYDGFFCFVIGFDKYFGIIDLNIIRFVVLLGISCGIIFSGIALCVVICFTVFGKTLAFI